MHSFHSDQPATATPLILVDDLSTLQWSLGLDPAELSTFYRHLRSLANEENATLLSILHADSAFPAIKEGATVPDAHSDLALKQVLRLSHLWITTRSLRAQMMGEVGVLDVLLLLYTDKQSS